MIEVNLYNIKDIDIREVSALIMDVKKASGQWREETTLDNVEGSMNRNFGDTDDIVLIAEENGETRGWLLIHLKEGSQAEINPWLLGGLPIVRQDSEDIDISEHLMLRATSYARETGISRVEMSFPREKHSEQVKSLLQRCGLTVVEEVVHMRGTISELTFHTPALLKSIKKMPLLQVSREALFTCWYDAFQHGKDRSYLSRGPEERKSFFEEAFDFTENLIELASVALVHSSAVVGFSLVRPTHGEKNGHLWQMGVHPEYWRRGLAKYLLAEANERLRELRFTTMSLNVDIGNIPAYNLYKASGLHEDWCLVSYAWQSPTR